MTGVQTCALPICFPVTIDIIKVLIYALGLIASALGITALTSCSSSRAVECHGKTTILIQDSTVVEHSSDYFRNFKYRY